MVDFVLFASVFVIFYGIDFLIEYFILGSTNAKFPSAIQSEQRKLLETRSILRELEVTLETATQQNDYQTTTKASEHRQEKIYHTVTDNTSIVVYSPLVEASTSFFIPLVYLGSLVAVFVLVFLLSKRLEKAWAKHTKTSDEAESEVFEDCVEELCEDSTSTDTDFLEVEWFDACAEMSDADVTTDVSEVEWFDAFAELSDADETTDVSEVEWFDACAELSDADETTDVFEDCVEELDQESSAHADVYMDCVEELTNESFDMPDLGLFMVSDEISSEDENQDLLIAFGDFTVQETRDVMEISGFVLTLPEKNSADSNASRKQANQGKEGDVFKTDFEISKKTNTAPVARELQAWQPEEEDEIEELECLEKEGEDLKDETILSPEEMYRLNTDVQSTFLEDLSQYTTKLDLSSLSKEQIEFAERMANEIMKENKQRKNKQRRKNSKRNRNY